MLKYEVVYVGNTVAYHRHGIYHRIDGPALIMPWIIDIYWDMSWYQYGRYHREDGPAYISIGGYSYYHLHGKKINGIIFKIKQFMRKFR